MPNDFFKEKKRQRSENNINEKKPEKKAKIENDNNNNLNNNIQNKEEIDISKLDPNSDEYWLALRKRIGLN